MHRAADTITTFEDRTHADPKLRRLIREERNRLRRKARRNREAERLSFLASALAL